MHLNGLLCKYSDKKILTAQFQEMDASKEVFGQTSTLTSMMTSNIFLAFCFKSWILNINTFKESIQGMKQQHQHLT